MDRYLQETLYRGAYRQMTERATGRVLGLASTLRPQVSILVTLDWISISRIGWAVFAQCGPLWPALPQVILKLNPHYSRLMIEDPNRDAYPTFQTALLGRSA